MSKRSREAKARKAEVKKAVEELDSIRCQLGESYVKFNNVTDPSALDTCIYEISALKAEVQLRGEEPEILFSLIRRA